MEASIVVELHELYRHFLDQLEAVRRVARQLHKVHDNKVSAGSTLCIQFQLDGVGHSSSRGSESNSDLDPTVRSPHDDPNTS